MKIYFVAMQEFLQPAQVDEGIGIKTKSRNRRRASRTTRRCRTTLKGKSVQADYESQSCVPATLGFNRLSSKSEEDSHMQNVGDTAAVRTVHKMDGKSLMYTKRVNSYIARMLTEGSEDDGSRSPPALTHIYSLSHSPSVSSEEPHNLRSSHAKLDKVTALQSARSASFRHAVPTMDAVTPSRIEMGAYDNLPAAKRRLFGDGSCFCQQSESFGGNAEFVGQLGRQNGYHTIEKLFTSSLNGKSLDIVDHHENGLLAIANAACLMSTGVLDHNKVSDTQGW